MPLPLLPQSAATSIGEDARKALTEADGEAEMFILPSFLHNKRSGSLASTAILHIRGGRDELMQKKTTAQALSGLIKRLVCFFDLFVLFTRTD
jgi:hypothetical protein